MISSTVSTEGLLTSEQSALEEAGFQPFGRAGALTGIVREFVREGVAGAHDAAGSASFNSAP